MKSVSSLMFAVCLALMASMIPRSAMAATPDEISARLDALEKENAALRARVIRLEASKTAR